ncbi:MAG TPA: SpoIIE family protein phosphatase [Spirochaetota bacterium]|nr:SpoIIE family protein phosphatase [Spirochaetota bacterium]
MHNKIKVLIVEDELIISKSIEMILKQVEYETSVTKNDIETLGILKTFIPDIILMDINLTGSVMDGIDLAKEIIKKYDIPVVFVTAHTDEEIIERAKRVSPYGYIVKPIDPKNLVIIIKIALYKHKYEKIIREKESWFSKSLQSISEGFISTDLNDNIKFINRSALNFIDSKENDVIGKNINLVLTFFKLEDVTTEMLLPTNYINFLKSNPNIAENIKIIVTKDKKFFLTQIVKEEIVDNNQKYGYVYLIKDLTKTILMTIELEIKNRHLNELSISVSKKIANQIKNIIEERNKLKERNEFIENELAIARKIQISMLPKESPYQNIYFIYHPVDSVGGDFFDFVKFREPELIGIFLCDVSGHGLSAGFVTTMIKNLILESGKYKLNPKELLYYLNNLLLEKTAGHFITAFYGIYNLNTKSLIYSSAGHNPPFLITEKEIIKLQESFSLPLAVFNNEEHIKKGVFYQNYEIKIETNSRLLVYTDGIIDIKKVSDDTIRSDENFILDLIKKYRNENDNKIFLTSILNELIEFRNDKKFEDDITMISIT